MSGVRDFDELLDRYGSVRRPVQLGMGLRPSGSVHLGNIATMTVLGLLGRALHTQKPQARITICDLDLPSAELWSLKEHGYLKYFKDLPSPDPEYLSLLDFAASHITDFVSKLEAEIDIPITINYLSDIQRDERFRYGLAQLLKSPDAMTYLFPACSDSHEVAVFPLCPSCYTTSQGKVTYRDETLESRCKNPNCSVEEFDVHIFDTDADITVHYLIDPIRDRLLEPLVDVHVFGGDYLCSHIQCDVRKIDKILYMQQAASGSAADILIGPTFYAEDGSKMSKTDHNGLTIQQLQERFGDMYVSHIISCVAEAINQGKQKIDYDFIRTHLLEE